MFIVLTVNNSKTYKEKSAVQINFSIEMWMKTKQFHFISDELEKKKTDDVDVEKNNKKSKSSEKSAENKGGEVQVRNHFKKN